MKSIAVEVFSSDTDGPIQPSPTPAVSANPARTGDCAGAPRGDPGIAVIDAVFGAASAIRLVTSTASMPPPTATTISFAGTYAWLANDWISPWVNARS